MIKKSTPRTTYLIIGGTTKGATTSVYKYLRDHPEICGSSLKETRFFLDPSYPTPIPDTYVDSPGEGYEQYFQSCTGEPVRVEATPTYLYSKQTPSALQRHLSEVRCVFILRDPIDRLVSWYRFAKQNGEIPRSISFKEYVNRQMSEESDETGSPWRVLEQGQYARYLQNYMEIFGEEAIHVTFFKYIVEKPELSLKRIANFAGVDPKFFDEYTFRVHNETHRMKSPFLHSIYLRLLRAIRYRIHTWPRIHNTLRHLKYCLDPIYLAFAVDEEEAVEVPTGLRNRLRQYFAEDANDLAEILGCQPPWCISDDS